MRCASLALAGAFAAALIAGGCGGGNSTETTIIGGGGGSAPTGTVVVLDQPSGPNTAEIVVDTGPATGFSLGVTNLAYVDVTLCEPASASACVTIDHVLVDTGSIGLRVLRSAVAGLKLPAVALAGGEAAECYPFVVGAIWGPLARADVRIGGERAAGIPLQLIDDAAPARFAAPADCVAAASGGGLLASASALQAKGVLGLGPLRYDCGLRCQSGEATAGLALYRACSATGCAPAAIDTALQAQNPVAHFDVDNNGTLIALPSLPSGGAAQVKGRLVFGIGTRENNQIDAAARVLGLGVDPAAADYLYLTTSMDGRAFPSSYVDSGSNAIFFDDPTLSTRCAGGPGRWYCPASAQSRAAVVSDRSGAQSTAAFQIANADALFSSGNVAFSNLGASTEAGTFVWGLPFFFGRRVYASIWGQALALSGPWVAF